MKAFCSTKDSMSKGNREVTAWRSVFAMAVTGRTNIYNTHTNKEMAKDPKAMNTQYTAIETQWWTILFTQKILIVCPLGDKHYSRHLVYINEQNKEPCSQEASCSGVGGRR